MRKVHSGSSFVQAEMIRSLLRENGIESFLGNEGAMSLTGVPLPPAPLEILVEDQHADRALALIAADLKQPLGPVKTELTVRIACTCGKTLEFPMGEDPPEECPWCGLPVQAGAPATQAVAAPRRSTLFAIVAIAILVGILFTAFRGGKSGDGAGAGPTHADWSRRLRERIAAIPAIEVPSIEPEVIVGPLAAELPEEAARFKSALEGAATLESLIERWLDLMTGLAPDWAVDSGLVETARLETYSARHQKTLMLMHGLTLQRLRTLASATTLLDGRLLERRLEHDLLAYTLAGADLRDPRAALWGVLASRHFKDKPSLLAERLEQVPGVVQATRKDLGLPSRLRIDVALEELNNALSILRDLEQPAADQRVPAALGKAREALSEYGDHLRSLRKTAPAARPQDPRWISFTLRNLEFSDRTPREAALLMLDESDRAEAVWRSWTGDARTSTGSYTFEEWRGEIQKLVVRARDLTVDRAFADIPPGELPEVAISPYPWQYPPEWPMYDARGFDTPFRPRLLVTPWNHDAGRTGCSLPLALFGVHGATYPGRHLQMLVSRRDASPVRRLYPSNGLQEGWHQYVQRWAIEHEPATGHARVTLEGFRYVQGWEGAVEICFLAGTLTEEAAVEMLQAGIGASESSARSRISWASLEPLYSTIGLLGEHDIVRLRDELRAKQGGRFDLKNFHSRLLGYGRTPIPLIREELLRDPK